MDPSADSAWIRIQQRTFTHWANNFLRERHLKIEDLETDLRNGVLLINLLEIISSKEIFVFSGAVPAYHKEPRLRLHQVENLGAALTFLKNEGIRLVSIGAEDIADGKLKLILGLFWTIILRYQVQKSSSGGSAKSDLLKWVRTKIPECNVNDFTNSWADGLAVCHLTEALKPGSFRSIDLLKGRAALENATQGERLAESELGIPQILAPEDLVSAADELSCMTYISYFRDVEHRNEEEKKRLAIAERLSVEEEKLAKKVVKTEKKIAEEKKVAEEKKRAQTLSLPALQLGKTPQPPTVVLPSQVQQQLRINVTYGGQRVPLRVLRDAAFSLDFLHSRIQRDFSALGIHLPSGFALLHDDGQDRLPMHVTEDYLREDLVNLEVLELIVKAAGVSGRSSLANPYPSSTASITMLNYGHLEQHVTQGGLSIQSVQDTNIGEVNVSAKSQQ